MRGCGAPGRRRWRRTDAPTRAAADAPPTPAPTRSTADRHRRAPCRGGAGIADRSSPRRERCREPAWRPCTGRRSPIDALEDLKCGPRADDAVEVRDRQEESVLLIVNPFSLIADGFRLDRSELPVLIVENRPHAGRLVAIGDERRRVEDDEQRATVDGRLREDRSEE